MTATLFNLMGPDIVIIAAIVLLLFGGSFIPKWAKGLRESRDEFRKIVDTEDNKNNP